MQIWTAPFADGWNAEQNAAGDIGCGGGGTRTDPPTVRVVSADRSLVSVAGPGRSVGWLNDQTYVYLDGYELRARPLEAPPYVLAHDVVGNSLRAADGHWGAVQVFPEAIGQVVYDGRILYAGRMWDGLALAGERLLHTKPDTDGWPMVQEYVSGQPARAHRLPAGGNAFTLHADGWIGAGYFGESWLLHPGSNSFDLVTVTPWRQEGPPTVALAPDGTPWLWTPTGSPSGRTLVLGRPYGSSQSIVLDLAATWLRVRIINGQWSVLAVDDRGQLRVATVPIDTPRQAVPWEPPAPEPVPPPPPPPVPPFPNPPHPPAPTPVPPDPPPQEPRPMVYSNRPLFMNPTGWLPGTLNTVGGGVTVSGPDGAVLSVQPGGSYEPRPAGTAGPYEVAQRDGDKLVFCPDGVNYYVVSMVGA